MNELPPLGMGVPLQHRPWWRHPLLIVVYVLLVLAVIGAGAVAYFNHWYAANIKPVTQEQKMTTIKIEEGSSLKQIANLLQQKGVIRSAFAFEWYVNKHPDASNLRAGSYLLSPSYSVEKITQMLSKGDTDNFALTLIAGKRLDQIQKSLDGAGFNQTALKTALHKKYSNPIFASKPSGTTLEGYIYPGTYQLTSRTTPEQFLSATFDRFAQAVQQRDIVANLKKQGLSLYQGITLASIVQQETSNQHDQQLVAQVFLKRLRSNISLGSDVTFDYAAHLQGVPASPNIDSPYNTRIHKGLPPGPISNINISALEAVAKPANTSYLYFVAGDDGKVYFSSTEQEHEKLTKEHCTKLCD